MISRNIYWVTVWKNEKCTVTEKNFVKSTTQNRYFHEFFAKKVWEWISVISTMCVIVSCLFFHAIRSVSLFSHFSCQNFLWIGLDFSYQVNKVYFLLTLMSQNPLWIQARTPLLVVTPNVMKNMVTKNRVMENEIL